MNALLHFYHREVSALVAVHTGHEITVEFDRPTPLQIDGETILNVTRYTARAAQCAVAQKEQNGPQCHADF